MRYLLCDDDAPLRAVLRTIVLDRGHEVVGEAETAAEARGLLALDPDVVIVDLALRSGSGLDVGRAAVEQGCRVLVFSAFIGTAGTDFADAAISKPDFFALEAAMDALTTRQADGARWKRGGPERRATDSGSRRPLPSEPIEAPDRFYQALGDAQPGDSIMFVEVTGDDDAAEALSVAARGVLRAHDHLMRRGSQLALLLVGGTPEAAAAVAARLTRVTEDTPHRERWTWKHRVIASDELPSDAYQQLRQS